MRKLFGRRVTQVGVLANRFQPFNRVCHGLPLDSLSRSSIKPMQFKCQCYSRIDGSIRQHDDE
jgi:hypothetical protein